MHSGHMVRESTWPDHVRVKWVSPMSTRPRLFTARAGGKSSRRISPTHTMASRVRHCVECPKCLTRYLPGFSPYRNGSYLLSLTEGFGDEWTLYCACGRPPISSRWRWRDLKLYAFSNQAHDPDYGPAQALL